MAMEFRIDLVDQTGGRGSDSASPSAAAPPGQPAYAPSTQAQQPAVPIPQLQAIQQTLLPAIATAAPMLARQLNSIAAKTAGSVEEIQPLALPPAVAVPQTPIARINPGPDEAFGTTSPAPAPAPAATHAAPQTPVSRANLDLDEAFGIASPAPVPAPAADREILPPLDKLTIAGREEGDILPPLKDLGIAEETPTQKAEAAQHERLKEAKFVSYREGETEAPPMFATAAEGAEGAAAEGAGGLEALGGAAGGAMAAAGPIGAAIGAAKGAVHATAELINTAGRAVKLFGDEVGAVADNDYIGGFTHAVDAAADSMKQIPIVGEIFAAELKLVSTTVQAFEKSVESFIDRGKQLSAFSPELMTANIRAEMRGLMADIHEANVLGPEIARLTDNWSEFTTEMRETFLPLKEALADFLADITEDLKDVVKGAKPFIELATFVFKKLLEVIEWLIKHNPLFAGLKWAGENIAQIERNTRKEPAKPEGDFISWLFDVPAFGAVGVDAARASAENPLWPEGLLNRNVGF